MAWVFWPSSDASSDLNSLGTFAITTAHALSAYIGVGLLAWIITTKLLFSEWVR
jgi:hypothetical protein